MKKTSKVISVLLVIVLALSVMILPASAAADVKVTAEVVANYVEDAADGGKIYKMDVWVNSSYSLTAIQLNLTYDSSAFQLLRTNKDNATAVNANMVILKTDPELAFYNGNAYNSCSGLYEGENTNAKYGYAMFPQDGTAPSLAKISDTNMGTTLKDAGYTGVYMAWMVDYTDNYLTLSGGAQRGTDTPLSGRQKVLSFYLKQKADAPEGSYTVGFNADQAYRLTGTYTKEDTVDCIIASGIGNTISIRPEMVSYTNATFEIGGASAPTVVKSAGQIKMTPTSATTVEDAFQLRIISKITSADWDANFANTAVDGATANYITKVGMVAYTGVAGDYNLDDAKAAIAAGASNGNYYYGETDYIKHAEGGDATFGTVLKCTHGSDKLQNDPICLGFVTYVDAAGQTQTVYYAETYTAPIVSNYDTLASTYAQNYWGK